MRTPLLVLLWASLLSFFIQGCGTYQGESSKASNPANIEAQGEDVRDGYVEIGDMLVHRSEVNRDDLKAHWPNEHENQMLVEQKQVLQGLSGRKRTLRLWPNGVVPVTFSSTIPNSVANDLMSYWQEYSQFADIQVVRRTNERDYVEVVGYSGGCGGSSFVGRAGGRQRIKYYLGCRSRSSARKIALHEMMHALGVLHEQSRPDRDDYITIDWNNIRSGASSNFARVSDPRYLTKEYDYLSIMHYASNTFAKSSSRPVISRKIPYQCQGSRDPYHSTCRNSSQTVWIPTNREMTDHDKEVLIGLYGSADGSKPPQTSPPTTPNPTPPPTTPTPPPTTPTNGIRADIQIYYNDAKYRFDRVLASRPNGTQVYFKSDETRSSTAYAHGSGQTSGDNIFSWALNRIYYIYCEAKDPSGNNSTYSNRCLNGLEVHSSIQSANNIYLEFQTGGETFKSSPKSMGQAQSTLLKFLIDKYGAVSFNQAEEALLMNEAPAAIVSNNPNPTPTNPTPTNPTPTNPTPTTPPPTTPNAGVRPALQTYVKGINHRSSERIFANNPNGVEVYFMTDEKNTSKTTVARGAGRSKGDNLFNQSMNRVYYFYCEAKAPKNNPNQFYNRCISGMRVYTQVNSQTSFTVRMTSPRGRLTLRAQSPGDAARQLLRFFETYYGRVDLSSAERDLFANLK